MIKRPRDRAPGYWTTSSQIFIYNWWPETEGRI